MSQKPVAVRFLQQAMKYNAGEIAGFAPELAANLVQTGVAEYYSSKKSEKTKDSDKDKDSGKSPDVSNI